MAKKKKSKVVRRPPRIFKDPKTGQRYIMIGKRKVKLSSKLSDKDLMKTVIKNMQQRRLRRRKTPTKEKLEPKTTHSTSPPLVSGYSGYSNVQINDLKSSLEKLKKEKEELEKMQKKEMEKIKDTIEKVKDDTIIPYKKVKDKYVISGPDGKNVELTEAEFQELLLNASESKRYKSQIDNAKIKLRRLKDTIDEKENEIILKDDQIAKLNNEAALKEEDLRFLNERAIALEEKANETERKREEAQMRKKEAKRKTREAEQKTREAEQKAFEAEEKASKAQQTALEAERKAKKAYFIRKDKSKKNWLTEDAKKLIYSMFPNYIDKDGKERQWQPRNTPDDIYKQLENNPKFIKLVDTIEEGETTKEFEERLRKIGSIQKDETTKDFEERLRNILNDEAKKKADEEAKNKAQDPPQDPEPDPVPDPPLDPAPIGEGKHNDKGGLYNYEIEEIMKPYKDKGFMGVISSDEIKLLLPLINKNKKFSFIMNTSPSTEKYGHWIAVYVDPIDDLSLEYYDPLAQEPSKDFQKQIKLIIDKSEPSVYLKFKINKIQDQHSNSKTCGWHSMKFLINRYNNYPFKEATLYNAKKGEQEARKMKDKFGYI